MASGCIVDFVLGTTARRRSAFRAPLYADESSNAEIGSLAWGAEVEILERLPGRSRIKAGDITAFVDTTSLAEIRYVQRQGRSREKGFTTPLYHSRTGRYRLLELLWGDRVYVLEPGEGRSRVRARGATGYVENTALGDTSLLELYFIDVGQGDGVLIRTPDGRHLLIDGGYTRSKQPTNKSAADFVDWKFFEDYGHWRVHLEAMIASHCDADHYGGLWDLVDAGEEARKELDTISTSVGAFYHAGVSWWKKVTPKGTSRDLGPVRKGHLVRLLGDRSDIEAALQPGPQSLQGEWAEFLQHVVRMAPVIDRLGVEQGAADTYLPGFEKAAGRVAFQVLAPIVGLVDGRPAVKDLGDDSQNTNGHSVLLRLTYGNVRILLTGDLNRKSMQALLEAYRGRTDLFACDVAKACHHGSDDVSLAFLRAMQAAATIISSGDSEGHGHPRPSTLAASALTGYLTEDDDELITPLIYATEIERSTSLGRMRLVEATGYPHEGTTMDIRLHARAVEDVEKELRDDAAGKRDVRGSIYYDEVAAGALRPRRGKRNLKGSYVLSGLIYGLVNVRTDGNWILCATRNEGDGSWNTRAFRARF